MKQKSSKKHNSSSPKKSHKKEKSQKYSSPLGKVWHFIWHDDSIWSWIVNIILSFILIKFLVYPGIGFALSTTHPIVAVVSGSMEHKTTNPCINPAINYNCIRDDSVWELCGTAFDEKKRVDFDFFWKTCGPWYQELNITKQQFSKFPFSSGFNTGDIMILKGKPVDSIEVGEVIVFWNPLLGDPVIHRVVDRWHEGGYVYFHTKGDHNSGSNPDELEIRHDRLVGYADYEKGSVAVARIPFLGYIKIGFVALVNMVIG